MPAVGRVELSISPSNPNVLYASIARPPNGGALLGLYRTDNAWATTPAWIQVPTGPTGEGGYCGRAKCNYSHIISVDPSNANTLFAGGGENGQGIWLCSDCGPSPTWTSPAFRKGVHPDNHAMAWAGNRLIVGNDGGVWSTADLGATWQNHNRTLPTLMFYSGALHPTNRNVILGGIRDFQISLRASTDTWLIFPSVSPSREWGEAEVAVSSSRPDTDWMAAWCCTGIISRTTDGGKSGIAADAGIDMTGVAFVAPVRKCPHNDDVFLTGANRLFRTDNFFNSGAPSWVQNAPLLPVPTDLPALAGRSPLSILAIAFSASDTTCNTYAYGNRSGQVRLTRDGGKTWTDLDAGKVLPVRPINSLAFDPGNLNILYAAVSNFDEATPGKPGHVFKSTNAMAASPSWVNVSPPLNQPFNVIAVDPVNPKLVYAGSDTGLWRSTNAAATWSRVGLVNGVPPSVTVHDIQINPSTSRTVVFTYGRGAYALDTGATIISQVTNAASYVPWITPGSLATVFGKNLSPVIGVEFPGAATIHRGVSVSVQGIPAPLLAVANVNGQEQINFQVPFNIPVPSTRVEVNNNGVVALADPVPVLSLQPGFFEYVPSGANLSYAAVIRPNASTVSPSNPAARGETVLLYLTGLGSTSPPMETGQFGPSNPPAVTTQLPSVSIGEVPAQISFSGYAPGFLGLYQMNVVIPPNAPVGSAVELKVVMTSLPGERPSPASSQTSHIAVQ